MSVKFNRYHVRKSNYESWHIAWNMVSLQDYFVILSSYHSIAWEKPLLSTKPKITFLAWKPVISVIKYVSFLQFWDWYCTRNFYDWLELEMSSADSLKIFTLQIHLYLLMFFNDKVINMYIYTCMRMYCTCIYNKSRQ